MNKPLIGIILFFAAGALSAQVPGASSVCCQGLTQITGFLAPAGMAIDYPNKRLYVADFSNLRVQVFNSDTESPLTVLNQLNSGATFTDPIDVAVDGNGNLFVADIGAPQPLKSFDSNFTFLGALGPAGVTANGVWADASSVYFTTQNGQVLQYNGSATFLSAAATYGSPGTLNNPDNMVKIGNWLYVADTYHFQIVKFNTSPPNPAPVTVLTNLLYPSGLRTDPAGNIYVVEDNNGTAPEYLDEFSPDFSVETQCAFPAVGIWGAAVNGLGEPFVSLINGSSVTLLQGCGTTALATATPTGLPTGTPTPPDGSCDQNYAYPNPVSGNTLKIHLHLCENARATVLLYNTAGEKIGSAVETASSGPNDFTLPVPGLSYGVYYYLIQVDASSGSRRLKPEKFAVTR